jgi:hypothetical protein
VSKRLQCALALHKHGFLVPAVDFTRLMQAYLLARSLADDPQMPDADRACCYIIAILIREASGEAAAAWENAAAWRRRNRDN